MIGFANGTCTLLRYAISLCESRIASSDKRATSSESSQTVRSREALNRFGVSFEKSEDSGITFEEGHLIAQPLAQRGQLIINYRQTAVGLIPRQKIRTYSTSSESCSDDERGLSAESRLRANLHLPCIHNSSRPRYSTCVTFNRGSKVSLDVGEPFQRNGSLLRDTRRQDCSRGKTRSPDKSALPRARDRPLIAKVSARSAGRGREILFRRARRCTRFHIDRFWLRNSILARTLTRGKSVTMPADRRSLPPVTMDREEIFPITRARRIEERVYGRRF